MTSKGMQNVSVWFWIMTASKQPGGSGRGNIGVASVHIPDRPECWVCGGFMKSNGKNLWACTSKECGKKMKKQPNRISQHHKQPPAGYDIASATAYARKCEKPKRILVTSAQHNTPIHEGFFKSLKQAAKHYGCEIAAIPSHYKNITLFSSKEKKKWADDIEPYLVATDIEFGNVLIKSDVRINATTLWPLAGKQAHGGTHSVVFGHPQVACEPIASPGGVLPKKLYTTGSITIPNYSQTNDGMKAEFHHVIGALIIEKYKDVCFVRQLNALDDGSFYDLDVLFAPKGIKTGQRALSLTTGDEHELWNIVKKETYTNKDSIVKTLRPEYIVRHDILDCYALSHHHEKDPMIQFQKHHNGLNNIRAELDRVVRFINETTPKESKTLIVPSNHHDHLLKALNRLSPNTDHANAIFIAEMQADMRKAALSGGKYDPFYLYLAPRLTCKHEFLDRNKPYMVGGVDMSQHGDIGTNGSKGAARGLAKTTLKMTIGHSHGGRIMQGVFQAGSSTGRLEYESGLSDHAPCHVLQYQGGKRTLIDIINGRWKL